MSELQPPNRTPLERRVAASHPLALPVELRRLWDPATCPAHLLPFLAWAFSVDQWQSNWPESVKRRVIASSVDLHRIKGTRTAIDVAMAALGVDVELTEWFEAEPPLPRGTFSTILYVNENLTPNQPAFLNEALYAQLREAIENAKNTRSHYTLQIGARFGPNTLGAASAFHSGALARNDTRPEQQPIEMATGLGAANSLQTGTLSRNATHPVQQPTEMASGLTATAAYGAGALARRPAQPTTDAMLASARLAITSACRGFAMTRRIMASASDANLPGAVTEASVPPASLLVAGAWQTFAFTHHTMESTT